MFEFHADDALQQRSLSVIREGGLATWAICN